MRYMQLQLGIWEPSQHYLKGGGETKTPCIQLVWMNTASSSYSPATGAYGKLPKVPLK
jgi:hypothetical protein